MQPMKAPLSADIIDNIYLSPDALTDKKLAFEHEYADRAANARRYTRPDKSRPNSTQPHDSVSIPPILQ